MRGVSGRTLATCNKHNERLGLVYNVSTHWHKHVGTREQLLDTGSNNNWTSHSELCAWLVRLAAEPVLPGVGVKGHHRSAFGCWMWVFMSVSPGSKLIFINQFYFQ